MAKARLLSLDLGAGRVWGDSRTVSSPLSRHPCIVRVLPHQSIGPALARRPLDPLPGCRHTRAASARSALDASGTADDAGRATETAANSTGAQPGTNAKRSPFPIEHFEDLGFPLAARFLWASGGASAGTGLKPLDLESDWLEQAASPGWVDQMKARHNLISQDCGCTIWDKSATDAAEELLGIMAAWLHRRQPDRYIWTSPTVLTVPELDFSVDLTKAEGRAALEAAAMLVQEELCLVRESDAVDSQQVAMEGSDGQVHTFEAGVVCFSFDPRKREGKGLADVHRPVPGYETKMRTAVSRVFSNLDTARPLWRANWALQNSPELISTDLPWHPTNIAIGGIENRAAAASEAQQNGEASVFADEAHTGYMDPLAALPSTPEEAGRSMYIRVEYETVFRLPETRWVLFTVKTYVDRLGLLPPPAAHALLSAVHATSPAELSYKSLGHEPLLEAVVGFLSQQAAEGGLALPVVPDGDSAVPAVAGSKCPFSRAAVDRSGSAGSGDGTAAAVAMKYPDGIDPWPSATSAVATASTPPASWYRESEVLRIEQSRVFRRGWQAVGRADQVQNVGDYFTGKLLDVSFLVVRGQDAQVHAFHNVCRHHAMPVAAGSGNACGADSSPACFSCPYHGWTYDTAGQLIRATRLTGIEDFHASANGLVSLPAEVWGPFVWLHLANPGEGGLHTHTLPGVAEWLGQAGPELIRGGVADSSLQFVTRRTYDLDCNWKVFCDNYLDGGYHVPFAHPGLTGGVDMKSYRTDLYPGGHSIQAVSGSEDGEGAAADRRLGSSACYGFIYPNFMINRYGPWMDTNWVVPLGPERCQVVFDYYLEGELLHDTEFIEESLAASDQVQQEDTTLCLGVQQGLASPAYGVGRYAPSLEQAMFHFHGVLHRHLVTEPED